MPDDSTYSNQSVIEKIEETFSKRKHETITAEPKHQETIQKFVERVQDAYKKTKRKATQFD